MNTADYIPARERTPFGQFQLRPSHLLTSKPGARFREPQPPTMPAQMPPPRPREHTPVPPRTANDGQSWAQRWEGALCAEVDPEPWFPEKGGSTAAAKRVCAECPLRAACLEYALEEGFEFGIFGGLSVIQRRKLRMSAANDVARIAQEAS